MKALHIELDAETVATHGIEIASFSIPLTNVAEEEAAQTVWGLLSAAGQVDAQGDVEEKVKVGVPIKIHWGFINLNEKIPLVIDAKASLVDVPTQA